MNTTTLISRLRSFAAEKGWRPSRFAKEAGLHANTLRAFARASWNPSLDTLRKLEAVIEREARDDVG